MNDSKLCYPFLCDANVHFSMFWIVSDMFPSNATKYLSLKSTNSQIYATQNYVALNSPSHLEIRSSEIQWLVKYFNKKPKNIFCLAKNYVALNSSLYLRMRRSETYNLFKHPNKNLFVTPFIFLLNF